MLALKPRGFYKLSMFEYFEARQRYNAAGFAECHDRLLAVLFRHRTRASLALDLGWKQFSGSPGSSLL